MNYHQTKIVFVIIIGWIGWTLLTDGDVHFTPWKTNVTTFQTQIPLEQHHPRQTHNNEHQNAATSPHCLQSYGQGNVIKILANDTRPPRHQKFIIREHSGRTLLIAHNTDLAPRLPISIGESIQYCGEYIPNNKGGLIHWTHKNPNRGNHAGGWLIVKNYIYQ